MANIFTIGSFTFDTEFHLKIQNFKKLEITSCKQTKADSPCRTDFSQSFAAFIDASIARNRLNKFPLRFIYLSAYCNDDYFFMCLLFPWQDLY